MPTGVTVRDNGWGINTSRTDSPLSLLAALNHMYGYVAVMWTDDPANIPALDRHLAARFPSGYLGFLEHPQRLGVTKFHEIMRPLQLGARTTYVDGRETRR